MQADAMKMVVLAGRLTVASFWAVLVYLVMCRTGV